MKIVIRIVCAIPLMTTTLTSALAADLEPKVVVIPLSSPKQLIKNGGFNDYAVLSYSSTYIMSKTDVSLPVDGTCVVTATGHVRNLEVPDAERGPYFRTSRQLGAGNPVIDDVHGPYAMFINDPSLSTSVAATYAWEIAANTNYRFGCAYLNRPTSWADDWGYCRVTWICSEN